MNRRSCLRKLPHIVGGLLFLAVGAVGSAQEMPGTSVPGTSVPGTSVPETEVPETPVPGIPLDGLISGLREQAVVLNIIARIVEQGEEEIWNSNNSKVTILGRPVNLKLIGENVVVYVQFTPYLQGNGQSLLVAQGQIWINVPNEGVRYQTTLQSIPIGFGEQVYFFPLGKVGAAEARIEIQLELRPYTESAEPGREGVLPE